MYIKNMQTFFQREQYCKNKNLIAEIKIFEAIGKVKNLIAFFIAMKGECRLQMRKTKLKTHSVKKQEKQTIKLQCISAKPVMKQSQIK